MIDLNALTLPGLYRELAADGSVCRLLALARDEDLGQAGDMTSRVMQFGSSRTMAVLVARDDAVVSGLAAVTELFDVFGMNIEFSPQVHDGQACPSDQRIATLDGRTVDLLAVERTMLNLIGRLSGIATLTRRFVDQIAGTRAVICDTRKTTPGLRVLEKYAVRCGGGALHRIGLHDAVLVKDNHVAGLTASQMAHAVSNAASRARNEFDLRFIEVEVDTLDQLDALLELPDGTIDIILLDNMPPDVLAEAVRRRGASGRAVQLEASGNVTLESVRAVAKSGVDRISVGGLTRSATCADFALDFRTSADDGYDD